jgi:hypothetical protein
MSEDYQSLLREVANLKRMMSGMVRTGTVKEVKGDKMRMVVAVNADGTEVLSPWLNCSAMRGGATERRYYKPGQTLSVLCPGGDIAQGMIMPFAPNKDFKAPDHASDEDNAAEEVYRLDDLRQKKTGDLWDTWLDDNRARVTKKGFSGKAGDSRVTAISEGATTDGGGGFFSAKGKRTYVGPKPPKLRGSNPVKDN